MAFTQRKIINDPVHGFITINDPVIFDLIAHPYYQRLRRIQQMALAQLVYPGAVHTRLHHSLGAYHLMCIAIAELKDKGIEITDEEAQASKAAILLHDIGHGPYSHALENVLLKGVSHEDLSLLIMHKINEGPEEKLKGKLDLAIQIFTNQYPKKFLHQLISGQLDVDRLDYLSRDSFFTGVSEGVVGYERILKMLTVDNNELVVEEKGINSVEKFLLSRRLMYWQVYQHKTVVASEKMLVKIVERARYLYQQNDQAIKTSAVLNYFLGEFSGKLAEINLSYYCQLDDTDILHAIKQWQNHSDPVLSLLCQRLLIRKGFKCTMQSKAISKEQWETAFTQTKAAFPLSDEDLSYLCFKGTASNTLYKEDVETIKILLKTGEVSSISKIQDAIINESLSAPVKKFYICLLKA
ncbi:MAG: HD domain-containing protein [Chitinophagaceae bacterium]|nr:HD domain-containing protein [Chitinophagaceae bacterium]